MSKPISGKSATGEGSSSVGGGSMDEQSLTRQLSPHIDSHSSSQTSSQTSSQIKPIGPAPVHLWDPPFCGDMDLRITKDGSWVHEGVAIKRMQLVKLFASILKLEADGCFYLVNPVEKVRIQVDDCPFLIHTLEVEGRGEQQMLHFTTNTDERFCADADHALTVEVEGEMSSEVDNQQPHPIVHVRSGLNGLLSRNVFYQLVELAVASKQRGPDCIGVWSAGQFFELGRV